MTKTKHSIKLTPQQKTAFKAIQNFIISNHSQYLRFSGAAGTGKSTLLSQVLLYIKNEHSNLKVAVASPTNKALKNIRLMANNALNTDASQYFAFYTLAKILGLYLDIDIYTGNDYLRRGYGAIAICKYDLVIIDEYSMIDEKTLSDIIEAVQNRNIKVLFCGDPFQLPPVKATHPPVCDLNVDEIKLFDVVRYDGKLAVVAEEIRSDDTYQNQPYPFESSEDGTIVRHRNEITWKKAAEKYFTSESFAADRNSVRFLAFTNKRCQQLSSYVRNAIYGTEAAENNPYLPNDLLIARAPVYRGGSGNYQQIAINSQEFLVIKPGILLSDDDTGYKYWSVLVEPIDLEDNALITLKILERDSAIANEDRIKKMKDELKQTLGNAARIALTDKIDNAKKAFDNVVYGYAITVHRSQCSTMERVFIDVNNIYQSDPKQKMLYTAVTRASSGIHVYGDFSEANKIDIDTLFD